MQGKTDLELINGIKNKNCSDCLQELFNRHSAICVDVCLKYSSSLNKNGVIFNDIIDQKEYMIYKSAMSYNENKGSKFSTWLANQMRYFCLNSMNKNRLVATEEEVMNNIVHSSCLRLNNLQPCTYQEPSLNDKVEFIKNIISQVKDSRVKRIFKIRYFSGNIKKTPWAKIAKEIGVSTQTAINLHNKTIRLLKTKMKANNRVAMDII
jgi:RNA polymerase sigma factor (sigma-70 family)